MTMYRLYYTQDSDSEKRAIAYSTSKANLAMQAAEMIQRTVKHGGHSPAPLKVTGMDGALYHLGIEAVTPPGPKRAEKLLDEVQAGEFDYGAGICKVCGELEYSGVEPDARGYRCNYCESPAVCGLEEFIFTTLA